VFFRESCFRQSGDVKRSSNPTHYRNPRDYFAIFDGVEVGFGDGCQGVQATAVRNLPKQPCSCLATYINRHGAAVTLLNLFACVHAFNSVILLLQVSQPHGRFAHFELVSCKCVDTYVRVKKNQNQICWKLRKVHPLSLTAAVQTWPGTYPVVCKLLVSILPALCGVIMSSISASAGLNMLAAVMCISRSAVPVLDFSTCPCVKHPSLANGPRAPQVVTDRPRAQLVRAFLDGSQYSAASIRRYERMFGKGFVSTGGLATTQVCTFAMQPCLSARSHTPVMRSVLDLC